MYTYYASTDGHYVCDTGDIWPPVVFNFPEPVVPQVLRFQKCEYCGSKMKTDLSNCTQCGAPLKIERR